MGLAGQKQVRHMYVGLKYPEHANIAALKAGTNGDLAVLSADGSAVAAGAKFQLFKKNNKGTILNSDIIDPSKVLYAKSVEYVAPVLGSATISDFTANANTLYTVEVAIKQFGSLSPEDEYIKKAFYKAKTGDTAENIVDGLVASLARNFSREEPSLSATFSYTNAGATTVNLPDNVYFSFAKTGTGASAALVITEKTTWSDLDFDRDRRTRTNLDFHVNATNVSVPTVTMVASKPAVLGGKQVAEMEFYLKGERNDFYRGAGYPHNFENTYDADPSLAYNGVELAYYDEGRDEAKKSHKQLTIVVPDSDAADLNLLIADLNTILGAGTITPITVIP